MLKIQINNKIREFCELHFQEIKVGLETKITDKLIQTNDTSKRNIIIWVQDNLENLIKGEVSELKDKIKEFDNKLFTNIDNHLPSKDEFLTNTTVDCLKAICRECNIKGFSNLKKELLVDHLISNQDKLNLNSNHYIRLKKSILFDNCDLDNIFIDFYENDWDKLSSYDRYKFVYKHGLKTCPYCNRNYIFTLKNGKVRPEIDHFFPKALYPYLAMSFYNLIPSCQICNHTKSSKDSFEDRVKSPYELEYSDFKFTYKPSNLDFLLGRDDKYSIKKIKIKLKHKVDENDDYFKLEKLYEQHKDIVLELIIKKQYYPKSYIKELKSFGFNKDQIYRYLLCNYKKDEDLHKRPLSKLIKDISEELELT